MTMLSSPPPKEAPEAGRLRGRLFMDLDRLAFALEMETVELIQQGEEEMARARQEMRLGVRLAQRLVAGIRADEVHRRLERWAEAYEARQESTSA